MTKYKRGDVVLVEVFFSERTKKSKKRPALVVSGEDYHKSRQEIVISAITSNVERILFGDTKLDDWKEAELIYPSLVTGIIQTVKKKMIVYKLGELTKGDLQKVQENLKKSLVLS